MAIQRVSVDVGGRLLRWHAAMLGIVPRGTLLTICRPHTMPEITSLASCAQINGLVNYHWYQVDENTLISSAVYRSKAHCEAAAAFYAEKMTELKKHCTSVDRMLGDTAFDIDI